MVVDIWVRDGDFTVHTSKLVPKRASFGDRDVLREAVVTDDPATHSLPRTGGLRSVATSPGSGVDSASLSKSPVGRLLSCTGSSGSRRLPRFRWK